MTNFVQLVSPGDIAGKKMKKLVLLSLDFEGWKDGSDEASKASALK